MGNATHMRHKMALVLCGGMLSTGVLAAPAHAAGGGGGEGPEPSSAWPVEVQAAPDTAQAQAKPGAVWAVYPVTRGGHSSLVAVSADDASPALLDLPMFPSARALEPADELLFSLNHDGTKVAYWATTKTGAFTGVRVRDLTTGELHSLDLDVEGLSPDRLVWAGKTLTFDIFTTSTAKVATAAKSKRSFIRTVAWDMQYVVTIPVLGDLAVTGSSGKGFTAIRDGRVYVSMQAGDPAYREYKIRTKLRPAEIIDDFGVRLAGVRQGADPDKAGPVVWAPITFYNTEVKFNEVPGATADRVLAWSDDMSALYTFTDEDRAVRHVEVESGKSEVVATLPAEAGDPQFSYAVTPDFPGDPENLHGAAHDSEETAEDGAAISVPKVAGGVLAAVVLGALGWVLFRRRGAKAARQPDVEASTDPSAPGAPDGGDPSEQPGSEESQTPPAPSGFVFISTSAATD